MTFLLNFFETICSALPVTLIVLIELNRFSRLIFIFLLFCDLKPISGKLFIIIFLSPLLASDSTTFKKLNFISSKLSKTLTSFILLIAIILDNPAFGVSNFKSLFNTTEFPEVTSNVNNGSFGII